MSDFKRVGAGWIKQNRDSGEFISMRLDCEDGEKVFINLFKNNYKQTDKHPDYIASVSEENCRKLKLTASNNPSPNRSKNRVYPQSRRTETPVSSAPAVDTSQQELPNTNQQASKKKEPF